MERGATKRRWMERGHGAVGDRAVGDRAAGYGAAGDGTVGDDTAGVEAGRGYGAAGVERRAWSGGRGAAGAMAWRAMMERGLTGTAGGSSAHRAAGFLGGS